MKFIDKRPVQQYLEFKILVNSEGIDKTRYSYSFQKYLTLLHDLKNHSSPT